VETADRRPSLYLTVYLIIVRSCCVYIASFYTMKAPEIKANSADNIYCFL